MDNVIGQIDRALDATGAIVAAVAGAGLTAPTPCRDWDVRAVLNHTVGGMHLFAAALSGTDAGADHESDWLGGDPQGAYAAAAEVDRAAWHRPGALEGTVGISLGELPGPAAALVHLTELLVHGTDIAVAIDRPDLADDQLCGELLATMQTMGGIDSFRAPGIFGPEVLVGDDEPAHRRLLAYAGREVMART
ncbi:TIGR03086 family metal-binding protein [Nocardia beijingensis]|uniref:TIGR03086 family metal-binding protein n=1 Tax=Nocardia beijingensis TaxID=95162 RepID=UPI0018948A92|nr:TIGR03086 family metal-binding protein [Nocardia beijingensis]MBF6078993.1 TIGR03086 family protein [Nocardia beijingensis]